MGMTAISLVIPAVAADKTEKVSGKSYVLDANSKYEFETPETSISPVNAGSLSISGDIGEITAGDVDEYEVKDGLLSFTYTSNGTYNNTDEKQWHLVEDGSKDVNGVALSDSIKMGAIVVQTSFDRNKWVTVSNATNVFAENTLASPFYTTNDIQLTNGCYYRVIVAYLTAKAEDGTNIKIAIWDTPWAIPNTSYQKHAEVFEFYAAYTKEESTSHNEKKFSLGSKVFAGHDVGFSENNEIKVDDVHYGWDLGNFFVTGYTEKNDDTNGDPIFLKNLGDKVTLSFKLSQDIDKLNGRDDLKVNGDANGYDQFFEIPKTDLGRGALIIRYTDHEGIKHDPVIYTNYLEALSSPGADTVVRMFEEGDYEVALDYELCRIGMIPDYKDYRIAFNFNIRNGNCMVYPFDSTTKAELTDSAVTQNGFYLDLARSRYLKINVTRSVWTKGAAGYTEDVRFNRPAKDGEQYTDEGIYTIEVSNPSTGKETTKKIYVGTDSVLLAFMNPANSKYGDINSISEKLDNGEIGINDGIISDVVVEVFEETEVVQTAEAAAETSSAAQTASAVTTVSERTQADAESTTETKPAESGNSNALIIVLIVVVVVAAGAVITVILIKKKKPEPEKKEEKNEVE